MSFCSDSYNNIALNSVKILFRTWDVDIICAYTKGLTIVRANSNSFSNWHNFSQPINLWSN